MALDPGQVDAVPTRVLGHAELVDGPDVARGQVERHEAAQLGNPDAPSLDVDVLPAVRLDVRVRDVVRLELALARDVALGHGRRSSERGTRTILAPRYLSRG